MERFCAIFGCHINAHLLVCVIWKGDVVSGSVGEPVPREMVHACIVHEAPADIGGDKMLPYMKRLDEANPALGWRAIRMGLDRPGLLRTQLRAMLRAAAGRDLKVMIPMVSTVAEFLAARELLDREIVFDKRCGREPPCDVKLGAMVEVPSLLWELDELAEVADFLSVGSNDLMQYVFAADRVNKRVAGRFDNLSPGFLRALKSIADAGARRR